MSRPDVRVDCETHGESFATFICRHLQSGEGKGFFCADDPNDSHPDAWCFECDEALKRGGGVWNEQSDKQAGVKMVCANCYDEMRARRLAGMQ